MSIKLVLADDHPFILDGIESQLGSEKEFKVVARCVDGEAALKAVRCHKPDVLVLDLKLPGKDGFAVLRELQKEKHPTRVIILTAGLDDLQLAEAVRLGARGLVLKEQAPECLAQCIRSVRGGELCLEQRSVSRALEKLLQREAGRQEAAHRLTPREFEIVKQAAFGLHNMEIATKLFISEGTVKMHLYNIYKKLDLDSRAKLTRYAQEKRLI
jgi:DNA-binding NarL/FixJ family response regulator